MTGFNFGSLSADAEDGNEMKDKGESKALASFYFPPKPGSKPESSLRRTSMDYAKLLPHLGHNVLQCLQIKWMAHPFPLHLEVALCFLASR